MLRIARIVVLAGLALAVSGCGADKAADLPEGAELAPASAPVYISISTDPNGEQWKAADRLLKRFPGREKLLAAARKELTKEGVDWERDIKPALPEEVHVVWFDFENGGDNVVGYAKPTDEAKFVELLESGEEPLVHTKIDDWTVFTDKQDVLDRFQEARSSGGQLSDVEAFRDAAGDLSSDAVVRGWVNGKAVYDELEQDLGSDQELERFRDFSKSFGTLEYLTFSAAAEEEGVKVEAGYKTDKEQNVGEFSPELDDALPGDALFYLSFGNLEDFLNSLMESADESFPDFQQQRSQIEKALGFTFKGDLFPLFSEEGAIAAYRSDEGSPIPNLLFVLRVDEEKARNVVDRLAALAELSDLTVQPFTVQGAQGKQFAFPSEGISLYALVAEGRALVSNSKALIEQALGDADKLTDDAVYQNARSASGAPDETVGFVYLNLAGAMPYLNEILSLSGTEPSMSPEVRANTKPLESVFLFAEQDGKRVSLSGFLTIK